MPSAALDERGPDSVFDSPSRSSRGGILMCRDSPACGRSCGEANSQVQQRSRHEPTAPGTRQPASCTVSSMFLGDRTQAAAMSAPKPSVLRLRLRGDGSVYDEDLSRRCTNALPSRNRRRPSRTAPARVSLVASTGVVDYWRRCRSPRRSRRATGPWRRLISALSRGVLPDGVAELLTWAIACEWSGSQLPAGHLGSGPVAV